MMILTNPKTICGFVGLSPDWRVYLWRDFSDDDWDRYALRLGPLYFSWSWWRDKATD